MGTKVIDPDATIAVCIHAVEEGQAAVRGATEEARENENSKNAIADVLALLQPHFQEQRCPKEAIDSCSFCGA